MAAGQMVQNFFKAFLGGRGPHLGAGTCAQPFGDAGTKLHFFGRFRLAQCLGIGVCDHEIRAFERFCDHVVDCIAARPANAKDRDLRLEFLGFRHTKIQSHFLSACICCAPMFGLSLLRC